MTKTDVRLSLAQRQRRFEWELARDEQTRAAAQLVAGKTHDLMNLVQIVQLATLELARLCGEGGKEFIDDLQRAARDAQTSLAELMAVARPEHAVRRGAAVGAAFTAAVNALRPAIAIDEHLAVSADTATQCTAEDIEHLIYGLVLDAEDAPRIELLIRDRVIAGKPWVEIVRGTDVPIGGDRFELRAVEAIATRGGGEVATCERRGGGTEVVVALPALPLAMP
jgi:hypothetical protein